jgi:hypothetical protein
VQQPLLLFQIPGSQNFQRCLRCLSRHTGIVKELIRTLSRHSSS